MTILFAASEMVPFCKTGGLADVIGALPPVLADMGHDICVMLPGYTVIDRARYRFEAVSEKLRIPVGKEMKTLTISSAEWKGITVHLLENDGYFGRGGLYGDEQGDYDDNGERFVFYARGVVEAVKHLTVMPDIVHAHDWQASLVIPYLATVYAGDHHFENTATLFTVHNLGYQGIFQKQVFSLTGLPDEAFHLTKMEYWGNVSFLKGGIVYADAVSTVSETYAVEITGKELGFGLHGVFKERRNDLYGIVNGIDQDEWNPEKDTAIPARYGSGDMSGKKKCRKILLKACGMKASSNVPVFGMVTRLDDQKGLDILDAGIGRLVALNLRLVILGTGTSKHHDTMKQLALRYPDRIHVILGFDSVMARLIYAGSDAFLMPSRYEPCGFGQLIAMRYGTLAVVNSTGGLADTVRDIDNHRDDGNGFTFSTYSSDALVNTVARAAKVFREHDRKRWFRTVNRAMAQDFSWKTSVKKYINLYNIIRNHKRL